MSEPVVDFPIYDADNHMYETPEAFTKHLPPAYAGLIKYVQVKGRTKITVKNVISDYIPNPTFEVVARPGTQEDYFRDGNPEGKSRREIMGEPMRALDAFFAPEPRLALMDELGIERAVMWPTLASLLEERLSDDPWAMHVVVPRSTSGCTNTGRSTTGIGSTRHPWSRCPSSTRQSKSWNGS